MKKSIRVAALLGLGLASALVTFGNGQLAKTGMVRKPEPVDPASTTRAVQQGKGSGMTRNESVLRGNAFRSETPQDSAALKNGSHSPRATWGDSSYRK